MNSYNGSIGSLVAGHVFLITHTVVNLKEVILILVIPEVTLTGVNLKRIDIDSPEGANQYVKCSQV